MKDQRVYRWSGPELSLIEFVVEDTADAQPAAPLRSLRGFEEDVACLLEEPPSTSSQEAS